MPPTGQGQNIAAAAVPNKLLIQPASEEKKGAAEKMIVPEQNAVGASQSVAKDEASPAK